MRFSNLLSTTYICALLEFSIFSSGFAYENPFLTRGENKSDSRLGAFSQNNTGDCFFLASLIAIAQDSDGKILIESVFHKDNNSHRWQITFPNLLDLPVEITEQEINEYKLTNSDGQGLSASVWGDPDVKILEIAADKLWKSKVKLEGLWDDVPMNAVFMFSNSEQLLIWNRRKATTTNNWDIDKYKRIPDGIIKEIEVSSAEQAAELLKSILLKDTDGISMILIDYINYHAVAINKINFNHNTYSTIDTTITTHTDHNLNDLLQGLTNGHYAINYLEIKE